MASLLQHLFPSPDGVLLIANQTGDSVGKLNPKKMGCLLRLIEDYSREHTDELTFKQALYDLLLDFKPNSNPEIEKSRLEKYPKLLTEFSEFCHHDLKITILDKISSILSSTEDEELENSLKISRTDPLFLTKSLEFILDMNCPYQLTFFGSGLLKEGELEAYNEALTNRLSETDLTSRLRYFRNKEKEFKTVRFIEILAKALNESQRSLSPFPLLVEQAVFSFFWQKAKTPTDILNFFSGYLEGDIESLRPSFPTRVFSEKTYWDIRNNSEALAEALLDPQRSSLLYLGYDFFENPLPLLLQYQTTSYAEKNFPDCIETLFANFMDIVCRIKRTELAKLKSQEDASETEKPASEALSPSEELIGHVFSAPFLPKDHPLNDYYEWLNAHPTLRFSQERRDRWATFCSALPHIRYLKSTQGKEGEKDCELAPGVINFLNLVRIFIDPTASPLPFEENLEILSEELNNLCELLSRENFKVTWKEEDLLYTAMQNDYFDTVTFLINEKKAFTLTMESGAPGHGYIKRFPAIEGDWRQTVDIDTLKKTFPPETLASFLTTPEAFEKIFTKLSPQDQIMLAHSLDLDAIEMKLAVIKACYLQNPSLKPLATMLIGSIAHLNDNSASAQLMKILIPIFHGRGPFLGDEEMLQIFKNFPDLLNSEIEDPVSPNTNSPGSSNNHLVLFALEHGKTEWLNVALPHIEDLILSSVLKEDVLLEFFNTYLPLCKKLDDFFISPPLKEQTILKLLSVLPCLDKLSELRIGSISLQILGEIILPPSLKKFSTSFEGITSWLPKNDGSGQFYPIPNKDSWEQLIPGLQSFFKRHPTITFEIRSNSMFSETSRSEIREILNIPQFPEGKFELVF